MIIDLVENSQIRLIRFRNIRDTITLQAEADLFDINRIPFIPFSSARRSAGMLLYFDYKISNSKLPIQRLCDAVVVVYGGLLVRCKARNRIVTLQVNLQLVTYKPTSWPFLPARIQTMFDAGERVIFKLSLQNEIKLLITTLLKIPQTASGSQESRVKMALFCLTQET